MQCLSVRILVQLEAIEKRHKNDLRSLLYLDY